MPTKNYVYSTLAADTAYTEWLEGGADLKVQGRVVTIKGGTGIADKHFITPMGTVTMVTDEELEVLKANPVFKKHVDNGFVRVTSTNTDPEKVVTKEDMKTRDNSAPLVPEDFSEDESSPIAKVHATSKRKSR